MDLRHQSELTHLDHLAIQADRLEVLHIHHLSHQEDRLETKLHMELAHHDQATAQTVEVHHMDHQEVDLVTVADQVMADVVADIAEEAVAHKERT
jgi:hypothetical protein